MSLLTQNLAVVEPTKAVTKEPIWRMSVEQYHAMVRAGILTEEDPVELLEGMLVLKMSKNPPHHVVTFLLRQALQHLMIAGWFVDSQEPLTTVDSEPEPDVTVVRGDILDYRERHPQPWEIALVVEVADATLRRDRGIKKRIYARAGIAIYWLVNLVNKTVVVFSEPDANASPPDYRRQKNYHRGDQIPVLIEGKIIGQIAVSEIIPELP